MNVERQIDRILTEYHFERMSFDEAKQKLLELNTISSIPSITVKLIDILRAPLASAWKRMCDTYGVNEWCISEGLADENTEIEISLEDAKFYGLID